MTVESDAKMLPLYAKAKAPNKKTTAMIARLSEHDGEETRLLLSIFFPRGEGMVTLVVAVDDADSVVSASSCTYGPAGLMFLSIFSLF